MRQTISDPPPNRSLVEVTIAESQEAIGAAGPRPHKERALDYDRRMRMVLVLTAACIACSKGESKEKPAAVQAKAAEPGDPTARRTLQVSLGEAYRRAGFAASFEVRERTLVISKLQLDGEDACRRDTVGALLATSKPNHRLALEAPTIDAKALESAGFTRVECTNAEGRIHGEDLPVTPERVPPPMKQGAIPDQSSREISFMLETPLGKTLAQSPTDDATRVMVALLSHCKQVTDVAADPLDDVWNTVRSVKTGQVEIADDVPARAVWHIVVEFDDRRRDVHKGMLLSFQIDERRERVRPADQLAGELCKLRVGRWTRLE